MAAGLVAQQPVEQGISLLRSGDFDNAAVILQGVVDRDPTNLKALRGLAAVEFMQAGTIRDPIDKNRKLDEAASVLKKVIALSPGEVEPYYTLGVIAWTKVNGDLRNARQQLGMKPEDPGPLKDFNMRQEMRARFEPVIEDGLANLTKALELDNKNGDAMSYMNLLLRSRADIRDTSEQAADDIRSADGWVQKALAAKTSAIAPNGIRVGGNVAAANLVTKVEPVYPPLALQARIQGHGSIQCRDRQGRPPHEYNSGQRTPLAGYLLTNRGPTMGLQTDAPERTTSGSDYYDRCELRAAAIATH